MRRKLFELLRLSLANRTEQFHLLLNLSLDSLGTGCEELSGIEALALEILALFDVLSCIPSPYPPSHRTPFRM